MAISTEETTIKKAHKGKKSKTDSGFERFMDVTDTEDLVAMILKTHLLAEYYLDQFIIMHIPRGDLITSGRFTFSLKLIIVKALNILKDRDIDAIYGLNSLRNDCSHVLNYQIGEKDVDKIGKPYGVDYLKDKDKYSNNMKSLLHFSLMTIIAHLDFETNEYINSKK